MKKAVCTLAALAAIAFFVYVSSYYRADAAAEIFPGSDLSVLKRNGKGLKQPL